MIYPFCLFGLLFLLLFVSLFTSSKQRCLLLGWRLASLRIHAPRPLLRDYKVQRMFIVRQSLLLLYSALALLYSFSLSLSVFILSPSFLPLLPHSTFPFVAVRLPRQSWTPLFGNFAVRCSFFCHFLYATPAAAAAVTA